MSNKIVVMKNGRKQQEGTPEEVYGRPANRFVADFLGHSNFLDATVVSRENESIKVRLRTGHEVLVDQAGEWVNGQEVQLVIRAQKFRIFPRGQGIGPDDANVFNVRIKERSYMGGEASYWVEIDETATEIHIISLMRTSPFRVGDELTIRVRPEFCRLLPVEARQA
jgi:putative spermidine/putrescine transport system ATP-binding protein/spermidine/putrescine transport system ATP-binding protein